MTIIQPKTIIQRIKIIIQTSNQNLPYLIQESRGFEQSGVKSIN